MSSTHHPRSLGNVRTVARCLGRLLIGPYESRHQCMARPPSSVPGPMMQSAQDRSPPTTDVFFGHSLAWLLSARPPFNPLPVSPLLSTTQSRCRRRLSRSLATRMHGLSSPSLGLLACQSLAFRATRRYARNSVLEIHKRNRTRPKAGGDPLG